MPAVRSSPAVPAPSLDDVYGANQMLTAALAGLGLAYIPQEKVEPYITKGRLKRAPKLVPAVFGLSAVYPSRRQSSATLSLVVKALRHRR